MAFSGTQTKCKSCSKTVYPMEQLVAEGVIFHKGCFRCSHCNNTLKLDNFVSLEGVFYCKPHYGQLFQNTGSLSKSFDDAIKLEKEKTPHPESITGDAAALRYAPEKKPSNPLASKFGGTQEKCLVCGKTVYLLEKITIEGNPYHKACFKCTHGGCSLTPSSFKTHLGKLYCKHHFNQLFLMKGRFSTLESDAVDAAAATEKTTVVAGEPEQAAPTPVAAASQAAPAEPAPVPAPPVPRPQVNDEDEDDDYA